LIVAVLLVNHKNGKLALKCEYTQKGKAKAVPGNKWNQSVKAWEYPMERTIVDQLLEEFGTNLRVSKEVRSYVTRAEQHKVKRVELKNMEDTELSVPFAYKLRNYQRVGANFLHKTKRAILADDMGTGKTLQAITACEETGSDRILVVCPASLKWNWFDEIAKWTDSKATLVAGTKAKRVKTIEEFTGKYLIINYEALRLHPELADMEWGAIVFDEAHKLKNRKAKQTKAAKKLKSDYMFLLTGTPMLNRADELWSLLNSLYPKEYSSYWRFVDRYCQVYHNGFGKEIVSGTKKQQELLRQEIAPLMIRRTKKDVLVELPDKVQVRHVVELSGEQKKIYKQMEKDAFVKLSESDVVAAPVVVAQLTRLRQIAVSPELLSHDITQSAKFDELMDIIQENKGEHKIAVFSQFRQGIELFGKRLDEAGIDWVSVTGTVSEEDRRENTRKFQEDPNTRIMLATIEAAGLGLTWTSADIAVFLDRHWTPAINQQAEDRLHRMGQKNAVTIINLVAKDTVEERIENMLAKKTRDFDSIINNQLTPEDIRQIFKN